MVFLLVGTVAVAQNKPRLMLSKLGNKNRIFFYEGEDIRLKVAGGDNYVGGLIIGLRDSVIHFRYFDIPVNEITEVDIRDRQFGGFNVTQYAPFLIVGGPFFAIVDWLNQGSLNSTSFIVAATTTGFGYLLWMFRRKRFVVRKRNKVAIIRY